MNAVFSYTHRYTDRNLSTMCRLVRVPDRIAYKLCMIAYRCLHGTALDYLVECCVRISDSGSRTARNRTAASGNLLVPRTRTSTYGGRSFRVTGPLCWNNLPTSIKTANYLFLSLNAPSEFISFRLVFSYYSVVTL